MGRASQRPEPKVTHGVLKIRRRRAERAAKDTKEARVFLENLVRVHMKPDKSITVDLSLRSYSTDHLIEAVIKTLQKASKLNKEKKLFCTLTAVTLNDNGALGEDGGYLRWNAEDVHNEDN